MKIGKKENGTMMPLGLKGKILGQQLTLPELRRW